MLQDNLTDKFIRKFQNKFHCNDAQSFYEQFAKLSDKEFRELLTGLNL